MLSQRLVLSRPLAYRALPLFSVVLKRTFLPSFPRIPKNFEEYPNYDDTTDPGMNGGYVNPPPEKRQFRDPKGGWWDKQSRRDWNEPVHEDEDILGRFSPEEYTHFKPGWGFAMNGIFIAVFLSSCGLVYMLYPDRPAVLRTFPHNGLMDALGGPKAVLALPDGDEGTTT